MISYLSNIQQWPTGHQDTHSPARVSRASILRYLTLWPVLFLSSQGTISSN
jgi:hypothetical protein